MSDDRRDRWEQRWKQRTAEDFRWYLPDAPKELKALLERPDRPQGSALDLGCGNGVATAYLAEHFDLAIGIDIAHAATLQARDRAREKGASATFVVAQAPILPFRAGSFALIFDRGCLQNMPRAAWAGYFREVERLLTAGGMLQLYVSRPGGRLPGPIAWARSVKTLIRRLLRGKPRPSALFLSPTLIRRLVPPSFAEVAMDQFEFRAKEGGGIRMFVYGLFRKSV
jgi:SAM-dependent methyltransferase